VKPSYEVSAGFPYGFRFAETVLFMQCVIQDAQSIVMAFFVKKKIGEACSKA
jgi:hypothetical protein